MKLKLILISCVAASSLSAQITSGDALKINSCYVGNKALFMKNATLDDNVDAVTWTETNVPAQRWIASDADEGLFFLTNAYSGRPLTNSSHRPKSGDRIVLKSNDSEYSKWQFIPVDNHSYPNAYYIRFSLQASGGQNLYIELTDDADGSQVKLQTKHADADSLRQMWTVVAEDILPNRVTHTLRDNVMHGWKTRYFNALKTSTGFWGEAEMLETILDAYETTGKQEYKTMFEEAYEHFVSYPAGWGQSGNGQNWNWNEYNDDIAWAVLASVRAYLMFEQHPKSNINYLNIAKNNYDLMYSRALLSSGMLRWKQTPTGNQGTNSCINGPAEVAACYLAIATGDNNYYDKAKNLYDLQRRYLYEPATGKVFDAGKWENNSFSVVNTWVSTYNQGTFLGAALMLYNHYGTKQYKNDAHKIVEWTRNDLCNSRGVVRVCGSGDDLQGFKGILMRYLRRYVVDLAVPEKVEWLQRNALHAYNNRNSKGIIWTAWWEKTAENFIFSDGYNFTNAAFGSSTAVSAAFNAPLSAGLIIKNAFEIIEAEHFDYVKGIFVEQTDATTTVVGNTNNNYYTAYSNVDFGNRLANSVSFRVLGGNVSGTIEVRSDSISGRLLGEATVPAGNSGDWMTVSCPVENPGERQNIYLVYKGSGFKIDHFRFYMKDNYIRNRAPLAEVPFTPLPAGSVKAGGWLLKQLQLQKEGLTGHAESLYNGVDDLGAGNDWLGGSGNSWERAPYYVKGLVALAYVLDDQELKEKAQKWIDWSLDNQRGSGDFGPAGNNDWWARMPMLYAIRDYYEATNDARVISFFTKYFQYQNNTIDSRQLSSWGRSRAGDNIEIVFWLYNRTGDAFLLELADKLKNQAYDWTDIFTNNTFNQFGTDFQPKHNVNVPQAMKMPAIYYQKSQSTADRDAYVHGREHLLCDHGQPHGMQSGNEMLAGKSSLTGLELCSVVEQMQSSETTQMILGDASIGDQLEKVAFNALPGSLTNDIKGLQYYQQANQVISKHGYYAFAQNYDNGNMPGPYSGYGCCRFDFHMGWPYFVKTLWAATADNGLAAMAYAPCTVTALVGDSVAIAVRELTGYPFDEQLTFEINIAKAVYFPLKFRIPGWCKSPRIKVNGVEQNDVEPGAFYTIIRTWDNNDVVTMELPMSVQINEEVNNSVSVQRGPLVYSLQIGENRSVRNDYGNGFREYEVFPVSDWNYALLIDKDNPEDFIQVNKSEMPENPYIQATTPVTLTVSARKLPVWTYSHNDRIATDPPYSPVETLEPTEQVTLVPYGSGTLRATCLPYIGVKEPFASSFTEDFSNGQEGWVQYGGSFYVKNKEYIAGNLEASHPCSKSVYPAVSFSDFTYEAKVQVSGDGDAGLMFRASRLSFGPDEYNGYYVGVSSSGRKIDFGKANGAWTSLRTAAMNINAGQWYHIKVVAKGSNIKIYVDNMTTPKIDFNDTSFASGTIGVRSYRALAAWDDISVTSLSETKISEKKANNKMSLYPNPIQKGGKLCIDIAGYEVNNASVLLYSTMGTIVDSFPVTDSNTYYAINVSQGIYLLDLCSDGEIVKHVKLIVK